MISLVIMGVFVKETLGKSKLAGRPDAKLVVAGSAVAFVKRVRGLGKVVVVFLGAILVYRVGYTMVEPPLHPLPEGRSPSGHHGVELRLRLEGDLHAHVRAGLGLAR